MSGTYLFLTGVLHRSMLMHSLAPEWVLVLLFGIKVDPNSDPPSELYQQKYCFLFYFLIMTCIYIDLHLLSARSQFQW